MLKYMIPLTLLFVGACGSDKDDETGDTGETTPGDDDDDTDTDTDDYTGTPPADPTIDFVAAPECVGGEIVLYAETSGWTKGELNLVNIWEQGSGGWNEVHSMPSVDFHPDGWYDILEQKVTAGAADYIMDESSLFVCDGGIPAHSNVYAIRVYDVDGNYEDCAIFEDRAPGGIEEVYAGTINDLAGAPPAEINSSDCMEWTLE